jgi:hypothetical protein
MRTLSVAVDILLAGDSKLSLSQKQLSSERKDHFPQICGARVKGNRSGQVGRKNYPVAAAGYSLHVPIGRIPIVCVRHPVFYGVGRCRADLITIIAQLFIKIK